MKSRFRYSFRRRLTASFLLISLVPLFLCSVLLLQMVNLRTSEQARQEMEQHAESLLACLDRLSQGLSNAGQELQGSPVMEAALKGDSSQDPQVYSVLFSAADRIRSYCSLHIYDLSGNIRYSTQNAPSTQRLNTQWGVLQAARNTGGQPVYMAVSADDADPALLQAALLLKDGSGKELGYLVMELTRDHFWKLFSGKYGAQDELLLLNRFWRPVYSSQHELSGSLSAVLRRQILDGKTLDAGNPDYIFSVSRHEGTGMYLLLQQPKAISHSTMGILYTISLFCALCCIVLSVLTSVLLSHQISSPIRHLQKAFSRMEQNDLSVQVSIKRQDELGQLAQEFNHMVTALKLKQDELVRKQKDLNEARLRMLQAQLNPHFLCNTLDTMKWISKINNIPQLALMSTNLADILRFCVSGDEFVPLGKELEVLGRYVEIQRIRLSDSFDFQTDIPEELLDCLVPKMILQPIVENAIIHGLNGVKDSSITVCARLAEPGLLHITITDNGKGLPPEMTGKPYTPELAPEGKHLGLYNVDTILKLDYGEEFGLFLDHGPGGQGAAVTAALPIHRKEPISC